MEAIGDGVPGGGVGDGFDEDGLGASFVAAVKFGVDGAGVGFGVVRDDADVPVVERDFRVGDDVDGRGQGGGLAAEVFGTGPGGDDHFGFRGIVL